MFQSKRQRVEYFTSQCIAIFIYYKYCSIKDSANLMEIPDTFIPILKKNHMDEVTGFLILELLASFLMI